MTGAKVAVLVQSENGTTFAYVFDREWARNALAADHSDNGKAPLAAGSAPNSIIM